MADIATLSLRVDATGAVSGLAQFTGGAEKAKSAAGGLEAAALKLGAIFAGWHAVKWAEETLNLGARYETLGVVIDVVGRNAGKSQAQMAAYQESLQKTGISGIGAREALARMAGAQLDLAKSSQLARIAQDAAVIANVNSTAAFETLINGITTGQPRILRTLGIFVDMEAGQKKYAESIHVAADALTAEDKVQANMNTVMASGAQIAGTYAAAMGTAGKQLQSTVRYLEDAREKASQAFQPAYTKMVFAYAEALKFLGENAPLVSGAMVGLAAAVGGLTIALKSASIVSFMASLANPAVLVSIAALGTLGVIFGTAAANAALAARDTAEYYETLKKMSTVQLEDKLRAIDAVLRDGAPPLKEYIELQKKRADILEVLKERTVAHVAVNNEAKKSVLELAIAEERDARAKRAVADAAKLVIDQEERLRAQREALLSGNLHPLATTGGVGGGWAIPELTPGGAAPALSNALEQQNAARLAALQVWSAAQRAQIAKNNADELAQAEAREREGQQIRENFLRQFQQTFSTGIANMLENGLGTWRTFFDSIKSLFIRALADMVARQAASGLGRILESGTSAAAGGGGGGSGLAATGAQLGIVGAIVGAFALAANAFVAAGHAASDALMEQHRLLESAIARSRAYSKTGSLQDQLDEELAKYRAAMKDLGVDIARTAVNREAALQEAIAATTAAYERHVAAIKEGAKAAEGAAVAEEHLMQMRHQDDMEDLEVRRLRAEGRDLEAEMWALQEKNRREYDRAVAAGWSEAELAWLRTIQQMEYAAWLAGQTAPKRPNIIDSMTGKDLINPPPVATPADAAAGAGGSSAMSVTVRGRASVSTEVGDRQLDNLVAMRVLLRGIFNNTKDLGSQLNRYLGNALVADDALTGNALVS